MTKQTNYRKSAQVQLSPINFDVIPSYYRNPLTSHSKMWGRRFIVRPCVHREVAIVEFRF